MVSSSARAAQRWAASMSLSFKTGLVISDAKAQQRAACESVSRMSAFRGKADSPSCSLTRPLMTQADLARIEVVGRVRLLPHI
jgi:hypothetical protein